MSLNYHEATLGQLICRALDVIEVGQVTYRTDAPIPVQTVLPWFRVNQLRDLLTIARDKVRAIEGHLMTDAARDEYGT